MPNKRSPKKVSKRPAPKKKSAPRPNRRPVRRSSTKKTTPKVTAKPQVADWPESALPTLIHKGRQRGFLTETELLYAFPDLEDYVAEYEKLLDEFDHQGINVVESGPSLLDSAKPEFLEPTH